MPVYGDLLTPERPGGGPGPAAGGAPTDQGRPDDHEQPVAAPTPAPEPGKSGPSTGVIVGLVMIGATLLVLLALSIPLLLQYLNSAGGDDEHSIGDCVVRDGQDARTADCGSPGAYEIVAEVESRDECADPTQPAIEMAGPPSHFFCLEPAGEAAEEPPGEPGEVDADQPADEDETG